MSEPFDFEAFVNGTSLARRVVSAYRVDNRDEIARLSRELDALPAEDGDEREASSSSPRHALESRVASLREQMEQSRTTWTLRTLGPEEFKKISEDESLTVYDQIAMQSRAPEDCKNPSLYNDLPNLTGDQWRQIAGVIGAAQWGQLVADANALILSKVAVPDFSQNGSATQKRPASSEN